MRVTSWEYFNRIINDQWKMARVNIHAGHYFYSRTSQRGLRAHPNHEKNLDDRTDETHQSWRARVRQPPDSSLLQILRAARRI